MSTRDYTVIFCELKSNRSPQKHPKTKPKHQKIVTWDEASQSRPPLRVDMSGPTPMEYNISNNHSRYVSSPAYSFGRKSMNIVTSADGQKMSPYIFQTDYPEKHKRPSPANYEPAQAIGHGQVNYPSAPAFSIGPVKECFEPNTRYTGGKHTSKNKMKRKDMDGSLENQKAQEQVKKETENNQVSNASKNVFKIAGPITSIHQLPNVENYTPGRLFKRSCHASQIQPNRNQKVGPSATTYSPTRSEILTKRRAPACSMAKRINLSGFLGNAQRAAREVPASNIYNPVCSLKVTNNTAATHRICGVRRFKRHDTGPFATL